ncbi:MAG TPA: response regulator, partial [candidate division Zixibacteria bacterium]|nr:response regulator [candidate division Zixibacteria bacterium]
MIESISVLIVDDEVLARKYLRSLLADDPDVRLLADCTNGRAAIESVKQHQPDIVFLDIQMPDLDGFEVLMALDPTSMPAIVFVTAFDRYALRAFEAHAIEYLLKPFDQKRFESAFRHAREEVRKRRVG